MSILIFRSLNFHFFTVCRVFFDTQRPFVEALPNRNTVLRSHDPEGRFFYCWSSDEAERGRVTESMYCVDHTPLASGLHPFSVARVIGQASRCVTSHDYNCSLTKSGFVYQSLWPLQQVVRQSTEARKVKHQTLLEGEQILICSLL